MKPTKKVPGAVQRKTAPAPQAKLQPQAPPVYRPQPVPRVLQAKRANAPHPHAHSLAPRLKVAQSKTVLQRKIGGGVIQRAEMSAAEEKKLNLRYAVMLKASLNGQDISAYVSKTSKYGGDVEHDHAEDGIIHAIQAVIAQLELSGGKPTILMSAADLAIAKALGSNNVLRIYQLTSSPCTTKATIKATSNKAAGEGCTEQLIDLASKGLDMKVGHQIAKFNFQITIEADHLYQPGGNGAEKAQSKASSADAVTRMKTAGITVHIAKS